jgi:TolB protein
LSSNSDELQNKLRTAIEAARAGDRDRARRLLEQVLAEDDSSEVAWLWMASVVNTIPERRSSLERVLEINPGNERALEALQRLNAEEATGGVSEAELRARQRIMPDQRPPAARRVASPPRLPVDEVPRRSGVSLVIWLAVLVGLAILALILVPPLLNTLQAPAPTATLSAAALATSTDTPTPGPTDTPAPTNTNLPREMITSQATLPPTFTPTFTPTPTRTLTPTPEPLALEVFEVMYTSLNRGTTQPDAYLMRADGSAESFLLAQARDIAFAPDGDRLAFIRDVEDVPQIFIVSFGDLENPTQITQLEAADTASPSWSPDGGQIVFSSSHNSDSEDLWIINADGSDLTRLTQDEFYDRKPHWSPVANEILFMSERATPFQSQIFRVTLPDAESGTAAEFRQMTVSGNNYDPRWSQDGQSFVYVTDRFGKSDLIVSDREGFGTSLISTELGEGENRSPALSPDNQWVAFVSNRDGRFQTYVLNVDGLQLQRITDNLRQDQTIIFRPTDLRDLR